MEAERARKPLVVAPRGVGRGEGQSPAMDEVVPVWVCRKTCVSACISALTHRNTW